MKEKNNMVEPLKNTVDAVSVGSTAASFIGLLTLPSLVYMATFIWTLLRIYEMETTKKIILWIKNLIFNFYKRS